jgi:hypothetical protein
MKRNIGTVDKIFRGGLGLFLVYIAGMNYSDAVNLSFVSFFLGFIFLLTSIVGFSPLYALFQFSTRHEKSPRI